MNPKINLWLQCAGIRAVKTMAQVALAVIGTGMVGLMDVDWMNITSIAAMAGICSLLTSIGGLPELKDPFAEASKDEE